MTHLHSSARCKQVVDEVLDLFIELGADDDQLDFDVIYASAINNTCSLSDDPSTQTPGFKETTSNTPSTIFMIRSTSPPKSAWPGVSKIFILTPL